MPTADSIARATTRAMGPTRHQVTVSLLLAEGGSPKGFRRSRKWAAAIALAAQALKTRKASKFIELELPKGSEVVAWRVVKDGIPYRCLYMYALWPLPAGWKGRVDAGYVE